MNTENTVITVQDLEGARELGRLSEEVRVLKWGAAIVVIMMFAYLTFLSQQISDLRNDLTQQISELHSDLTQQIDVMQEGQVAIRERMTVVEQRLMADSS